MGHCRPERRSPVRKIVAEDDDAGPLANIGANVNGRLFSCLISLFLISPFNRTADLAKKFARDFRHVHFLSVDDITFILSAQNYKTNKQNHNYCNSHFFFVQSLRKMKIE